MKNLSEQCVHLVSRKTAKENSLKYYFSGNPCPKGHVSFRRTHNGECRACAIGYSRIYEEANKDKRNEKSRRYARENKDKIMLQRSDKKEEYALRAQRWVRKNRDKVLKRRRHLYWADVEKYRKYSREWKARNPEKIAALIARHKDKMLANTRNRRARLRQSEGSHNNDDIILLFALQDGLCNCCQESLNQNGGNKFHVDHIFPVSRGGSNGPENLQLLCPFCNMSKGNQDPYDWASSARALLMSRVKNG